MSENEWQVKVLYGLRARMQETTDRWPLLASAPSSRRAQQDEREPAHGEKAPGKPLVITKRVNVLRVDSILFDRLSFGAAEPNENEY